MNRYDSYKDSGVEWIGEIPNSWRKLKIKHLFFHSKGKNGQKLTKEFIGNNPGEYPVYSGTTKGEGHLGRTNEYEFDTYGEEVIFVSTVGSDTTVMSTKVLSGRFNLSQNCLIMSPKFDFSTKYQYYFTTHDFPYQRTILPIVLKEGHRSVGMGELNEFTSLLPPLSEQQQIVSFLDTKTSLIDSLIQKTQRKIELLKEKRTSLINEVVTKGLNPNVEMKDSGVEWIGKIPSHWLIKPLFTVCEHSKEKNEDSESTVLSLSYGKLKVREVETNFGLLPESFDNYQRVRPGYIILRLTDLQNDKKSLRVGHSYLDGIITPVYVGLKCNSSILSEYLYYHLHNSDIKKVLYSLGGGLRQTLRFNELKRFPVPIFPIEQQQQIVEYLDEQTQKIDKTISIEEKRIELLKEYRQSLISEVVTGKRKVVEL